MLRLCSVCALVEGLSPCPFAADPRETCPDRADRPLAALVAGDSFFPRAKAPFGDSLFVRAKAPFGDPRRASSISRFFVATVKEILIRLSHPRNCRKPRDIFWVGYIVRIIAF